jgi:Leucine-rich repeat (LRR) protein
VRDRSGETAAAPGLKPSPPRSDTGKLRAMHAGVDSRGTSKLSNRSRLPRARPMGLTSHGKENIIGLMQTTMPSSVSPAHEELWSPGTDDTVESNVLTRTSVVGDVLATVSAKRPPPAPPADSAIEFDDGKSTDITPEMLRECLRKEANHDDLERLLAADLSGRYILLITRLNKARMLRTLDLSYNRIRSMKGLDSLYQLRELRLTCNKLTSISELNKLTALEHLHLQVNRISEIGNLSLRENKKLRTLRLDGNELKRLQHLDGQVVLQHFDASQNCLTKIEGLGMMGQLEVLALAFNQIQVIEGLGAMGRLRELDLSNNQISVIAGLKQCGQLEILRLDDNQLQNLDGLTRMPNMVELYVNNNQLTRATAQMLKMCPALEFLHLAGNNLTELSEVKGMAGLTNLIDLRLAENPICKFKGYDEHVKEYLSAVDTLDDEDIRGVRAAVVREDFETELPKAISNDAAQNDLLTEQVLDRGGVIFSRARDFGAKELADVVPIEEFEGMLRGIRDGIATARQTLHDSMYKLMFPPEETKTEKARKEQEKLREAAERDARMATRAKELQTAKEKASAGYSVANAAVEAVLQRRRPEGVSKGANAPSLSEIMAAKRTEVEARRRAAKVSVMGEEAVAAMESAAAPPQAKSPAPKEREAEAMPEEGENGAAAPRSAAAAVGGGVARSMREVELPESMRRMNEELEKRLAATTQALQLQLAEDGDEDAPSPRHPAPTSPTPHPTKDQMAEMRQAAAEDDAVRLRAHTAASEQERARAEEQQARFVEHLIHGTENLGTLPLRPETPPASAQKERPARDLERATPSKQYDISSQTLLASAEKLRMSHDGLRRSYDPESWESISKRRHSAAETEMFTLDYEKTQRAETTPPRRRPQSSRPIPRTVASEGEEAGNLDLLRESLSSRASKRLAEAIEFSATQSPASDLSPRSHRSPEEEEEDEVLYEYEAPAVAVGADSSEDALPEGELQLDILP